MKKRKAFTLIELLIVVAIIAILAVIIVLNLLSARDKANYAKVKAELQTLSDGIRLAYVDGPAVNPESSFWIPADADSLARFKDSAGNAIFPTPPVKPSNWPSSYGSYQFYNASSTSFGARIADKDSGEFCGFLNGSKVPGDTQSADGYNSGALATYSACDGS